MLLLFTSKFYICVRKQAYGLPLSSKAFPFPHPSKRASRLHRYNSSTMYSCMISMLSSHCYCCISVYLTFIFTATLCLIWSQWSIHINLQLPGGPLHTIDLQMGVLLLKIILQNLKALQLCSGTRLIVKALIEAIVLTGCAKGDKVFIPGIPIIPSDLLFIPSNAYSFHFRWLSPWPATRLKA